MDDMPFMIQDEHTFAFMYSQRDFVVEVDEHPFMPIDRLWD